MVDVLIFCAALFYIIWLSYIDIWSCTCVNSFMQHLFQVSGVGYNANGSVVCRHEQVTEHSHPSLTKVIEVGCICNDADLCEDGLHGQPTEGALIAVAWKVGHTCMYLIKYQQIQNHVNWTIYVCENVCNESNEIFNICRWIYIMSESFIHGLKKCHSTLKPNIWL